jgi:hypothetical protein
VHRRPPAPKAPLAAIDKFLWKNLKRPYNSKIRRKISMGNIDISPESASSPGKPTRPAEAASAPLLISDLDWSAAEAKETRARLAALEEDWDAPGMEAYDHL